MEPSGQCNEDIPLLTALPMLQRLTMSSFDMKHFEFTKTQLTIFTVLAQHESLTMTEIAEYISSSAEQATRAVAPLVDAGYVERFIEPENRKKVHIRLTKIGQEYLDERRGEYYSTLKKRLDASLNDEERTELRQAVNTIIRIMSKV